MGIADDLDKRYDEYVKKTNTRQLVLKRTAANIADGFVKHLGSGPNCWNRPDGKVGGKKVQLGIGQGTEFKEVPWEQLKTSQDGSLSFAISYMLSGETGNYRLTFDCKLKCNPDGYSIHIQHVEPDIRLAPEDISGQRFDSLFNVMVEAISSRIDPALVVIPQA